MHIIARSNLLATLTSKLYDPEGDFNEEMSAFATAILANHAAEWFVVTDHENGGDPEVTWYNPISESKSSGVLDREIIPLTYNKAGDSYYGMSMESLEWDPERALFHCYLGGCDLQSAPGFVISTASM